MCVCLRGFPWHVLFCQDISSSQFAYCQHMVFQRVIARRKQDAASFAVLAVVVHCRRGAMEIRAAQSPELNPKRLCFEKYSGLKLRTPPPAIDYSRPTGWSQIEGNIEKVVQRNNLRLNRDTLSNGDCGLDAIVRNLQRLRPANEVSQGVLETLDKKGRQAACHVLRLQLLIWLKNNAAAEILPGLSIADWAIMDGQPSFVSYISHMRNPHVWVDTPMLHAASAVLGLQIVCFMGSPEPSIIAAPNVLSQAESPVAVIANVGNLHFYALGPDHPTYDVEPLDLSSADDALLAWSANSSLHEWQDNIANVTEAECSRSYGAPGSHTEYDAQLFKLGDSLMSADLFGNITCDQELSQLVASQDASDASNVDDNCFMVYGGEML